MFAGLYFMFPIVSVNMTKARIKIISDLIDKNGGCTDFRINEFIANLMNGKGYFIVGTDVQPTECYRVLNTFSVNEYRKAFIKPDWITQSIQKKQLLNPRSFKVFLEISIKITELPLPKLTPAKIEIQDEEDQFESEPQQELSEITADMAEPQKYQYSYLNKLMRDHRQFLDYLYDPLLDNYHSDIEVKQELIYVPDEDCYIEEKSNTVSIFDGIELIKQNVVDEPIISAPMRDPHIFNPGHKKNLQKWEPKKNKFVFEAGASQIHFNDLIIGELEKLLKIYTNEKDKGRMIAYRKAIGYIRSLKFPIKSEDDIANMPTIGEKIKKKIIEIINTGKLLKAENLQKNAKNIAVQELSRVWGIGAVTATTFYFKGIKTLDDLRDNIGILSRNQQIGLQYVEEFEQRIPRDEVTQICEIVKKQMDLISFGYEAIPCGSYRRGAPTCGDIDILITRLDGKRDPGYLLKLVRSLEGTLLTDHLQLPMHAATNGSESYMGVCQYKGGIHRRIDIKYYPREQFGYAVLYFTGSDHFNRSMRLYAQKLGYSLSDHGLYPTLRTTRNQKVWQGELIPCYTEQDVFKLLGVEYKEPKDRSV